jgi:adenylate cyclase
MAVVLSIGDVEIDVVRRSVTLGGRSITLGSRAFDVLQALGERSDRVVSKNELFDLAWSGLVVEENNLTVQIAALRKVLGKDSIVTVPGRGYRLGIPDRRTPLPVAAPAAATLRLQRRLVAIAQASIVGWGKLVAREAAEAIGAWKALREDTIEQTLTEHGGRAEELTPTRMRLVFDSVVDAVEWALDLQHQLAARREQAGGPNLHVRIGIVVDDAVLDDGKLLGMGVQAIDELHSIAQHDEVLVTDAVRHFVMDKLSLAWKPLDAGVREGRLSAVPLWLAAPVRPVAGPDAPSRRLPVLAVLPLHNLGSTSDEYLADGLTEQVIAFLSRNRSLAVIAHASTLAVKAGLRDGLAVEAAASSLGAQYVLEGTLHREGGQLVIDVSLAHVPSRRRLLEQPFAGSLADMLGFQEQLAADIAAAVDPQLLDTETRMSLLHPASDASAYDFLLRGMAVLHNGGRADAEEAESHFLRALELDPDYAQAHAQLAWWHNLRVGEGRLPEVEANRQAAVSHAQRAVDLDSGDSTVLSVAGHIQSFLCKNFTEAMALFDHALHVNPSCAMAWARSATTLAYVGQGQPALERVTQALRLSPQDPNMFSFLTTRGTASLVLERYDEAVAWLAKARELKPGYVAALRLHIAACMLAGERDQAMALAEQLMQLEPAFNVAALGRWYPLQQPHLGRVLDAMRRAGLPH